MILPFCDGRSAALVPCGVKPQRSPGAFIHVGDLTSQGLVWHWNTVYCARSETKEVVLWSATASENNYNILLHFFSLLVLIPD